MSKHRFKPGDVATPIALRLIGADCLAIHHVKGGRALDTVREGERVLVVESTVEEAPVAVVLTARGFVGKVWANFLELVERP